MENIVLPPQKVLYDECIEFRLLSPKDSKLILQGITESLEQLERFMSWSHHKMDYEQACRIYAGFQAQAFKGEGLNIGGFDTKTGELLCVASLVPGSHLNAKAFELGYWVNSKHTGKGIGTNAARIMVVLAFNHYAADRVSVVCNTENFASLAVIRKCGFVYEGNLRNYLCKPTKEMLAAGYSSVREVSTFSIVTEDIQDCVWFHEYATKLEIISF